MSAVTSGARLAAIPALNRVLAAHGLTLPPVAAAEVVDAVADTIAHHTPARRVERCVICNRPSEWLWCSRGCHRTDEPGAYEVDP